MRHVFRSTRHGIPSDKERGRTAFERLRAKTLARAEMDYNRWFCRIFYQDSNLGRPSPELPLTP